MADEIDRASDQAEALRQTAIAVRKPVPGMRANGHCLSCNNKVPDGYRWCDASCRDNWEKENG